MIPLLSVRMARWRACRLQTLLLVLLCACGETVEPTVLRFYVYSDVGLARVRAFLLADEAEPLDGGGSVPSPDLTPLDAGAPGANLLFSIAVEHTPQSKSRQAVLHFEGYDGFIPDSQIVLRQTVRAEFTDRETRLVRIWLSPACERAMPLPCKRPSEPFDATADLWRWTPSELEGCASANDCSGYCAGEQTEVCPRVPLSCEDSQNDAKNCGACGLACEYPRCSGGVCTPTAVAPTRDQVESIGDPIDFSAIYMRRLTVVNSGIAAIGIDSDDVGAKFQLFIAAAGTGRKPGAIREVGEVEVKHASTSTADGLRRGTEWIFAEPLRFTEEEQAFWIGVAAVGGAAGVRVAQFAANMSAIEVVSWAASIPAKGQWFADSDTAPPMDGIPSPHVYVVYYP